jgi:hypothetical protein
MTLDKALYQQAYRSYRQWNEAGAASRMRDVALLTPAEAWRRYVALVEFCWLLSPGTQPASTRGEAGGAGSLLRGSAAPGGAEEARGTSA